jgi:hypothetical protein
VLTEWLERKYSFWSSGRKGSPSLSPLKRNDPYLELNMRKLAATIFLTVFISVVGYAQSPPTLRIVTETPGLPSELFYGDIKVKPLRLRPGTNTVITINDFDFFVSQQYIDFLKRFPEPAGLQFYIDTLNPDTKCAPTDTECRKVLRGIVAANFFRSPEFQRKGSYVMYLYMISIGQRPVTVAELSDTSKVDRPHYTEFMSDLAAISTPNDDPALTEQKKNDLANAWMLRAEIQAKYGALSNAQFVQTLLNTAGVTNPNQAQLVADLDAATKTRAQVLRIIAESTQVSDKFYKQAFVTMEYFGFLRRDPEVCVGSPDPSQCGFIFHNARFNLAIDPAVIENVIVRGFMESPEYLNRF